MLSDDEVLLFFDVVSLFTNVPTDLPISVAHKRLEDDKTLKERTGLEVDDITQLLKMCLDATYLTFHDTHYQQTFGTAMGSPVSVTVANLVMEEIESKALSTFTPAPHFWKRYVDDTCTAIPSHLVAPFHDHLNGVNEHTQFTLEIEADSSLPFLDIMLHHQPCRWIHTHIGLQEANSHRSLLGLLLSPPTRAQKICGNNPVLSCQLTHVHDVAANGRRIAPLQEAEDERISSTLHPQSVRREEKFEAR